MQAIQDLHTIPLKGKSDPDDETVTTCAESDQEEETSEEPSKEQEEYDNFLPLQTEGTPVPFSNNELPVISQEEEDTLPTARRYNLHSPSQANQAQTAAPPRVPLEDLAVDPKLIPAIKIRNKKFRYSHEMRAANHALQIHQLRLAMDTHLPEQKFAYTVLNEKTGRMMEFRHRIKNDVHHKV